MKPNAIFFSLWAATQLATQAQVGIGTTTPDASAQLDVTSSTLGFLPPRMTQAQREAIDTPAAGLLVYQTNGTIPGLYIFDGSDWTPFSGKENALTFSSPFSRSGDTISLAAASASSNGYLSSADWTAFNAKESALSFSSQFSRSGNTITLATASATTAGALSSADWANFNTAYGWGNHASAGYLTSFTETDPLFAASAAQGIAAGDITAWNAKVGGSGTTSYVPMFTASGTVGNSALFSDATGKVGIGTGTPAYDLDVAGSINATDSITIGGVPVATSTDTYWSIAGVGPDIQYSGGKVGIGTAAPAYTLDVGGDVNVTGNFRINGQLLGGSGTVTSVAGSGGSTGLTVTGGPVTTAGTLTLGGTLALTSGGTGATTATAARSNLGLGTAATLAAASASTASAVVQRDASGNFSAGTITASLTGTASKATNWVGGNSTTLLGAIGYQSAADTTTLLAPNTSTTKKFLRMTGTGVNGAVPAWDTLVAADVPTLNQNSTGTAANVTGTVAIANGGTGATTAALARTALSAAASGANGDITSLTGLTTDLTVAQGGTGASTLTGYVKGSGTSALTASATIPAADISGNITGSAANVTGTVAVANGGTGLTTYAVGDLPYASGTTTLSKLADIATGNALISGGVGAAPAWGKIGLTTHVTGTLPVANGGTGKTTETNYAGGWILYGEGNSTPGASTSLTWDRTNKRLGIGDSSPSYAVDVAGDVNVTGAFRVNGTAIGGGTIGGSGSIGYLPLFTAGTSVGNSAIHQANSSSPLIIDGVNLLINTSVELAGGASTKLNVAFPGNVGYGMTLRNTSASTTYALLFQNSSGGSVGSVAIGASTTNYITTSDRRLKENITPTRFGLADLMKVQPVDYNFIADAAKTVQTGFIAQDLDTVFPDAVTVGGDDANTNPWSVDYGRLTPLLVKSIQDLKAENDALKADNEAIKAQNAAILKRLEALEAK